MMPLIPSLKAYTAVVLKALMNIGLEGVRYLLWLRRRPVRPRRICIHRVGQIGDMVCALPAMRAVRRAFPDAELTLFTSPGKRGNPGAEGLLADAEWLDSLLVYHADEVDSFSKAWAMARQLRQRHFDLWIEWPQDLTSFRAEVRNMLFAKLTGAAWAAGFRVNTVKLFAREQARALPFRREAEVLLGLARRFGAAPEPIEFALPIKEHAAAAILERMADLAPGPGAWLALVPGGKRPSNRWPVERFAEMARRWTQRGGWVVVLGGGGDAALGQQIVAGCEHGRALDLCGKTNLLETAAVLKNCALLLTNDTGPMHLAAAVGTHCVVAFSARDFPVKWYPWGEGHAVLRKAVACSPCLREECKHDNLCLIEISVDEAWQAILSMVGGDSR